MKRALACLAILCAPVAAGADQKGKSPEASKPKKPSVWMDVKVEEAQKVFAALARADFKAINESTEKLKTLGALEAFVRRSTPDYRTQLRSFEFAVNEIQRQAKQENIEGVTMGFNQLTLSCVNCHKQLRHVKKTTVPASDSATLKQ